MKKIILVLVMVVSSTLLLTINLNSKTEYGTFKMSTLITAAQAEGESSRGYRRVTCVQNSLGNVTVKCRGVGSLACSC